MEDEEYSHYLYVRHLSNGPHLKDGGCGLQSGVHRLSNHLDLTHVFPWTLWHKQHLKQIPGSSTHHGNITIIS